MFNARPYICIYLKDVVVRRECSRMYVEIAATTFYCAPRHSRSKIAFGRINHPLNKTVCCVYDGDKTNRAHSVSHHHVPCCLASSRKCRENPCAETNKINNIKKGVLSHGTIQILGCKVGGRGVVEVVAELDTIYKTNIQLQHMFRGSSHFCTVISQMLSSSLLSLFGIRL